LKTLLCASLQNNSASVVNVEATFARGLPGFSIVGLAQASIQESKERVKAALNSLSFSFPPSKIIINLSPSDISKQGSHFDLAIALSIALQKEEANFEDYFIFGELGLDGKLKDTNSIFALLLDLAKLKNKKFIIPHESLQKASIIPDIELYGAKSLQEVIGFFRGENELTKAKQKNIESKKLHINQKNYYYIDEYEKDFIDVKGQQQAIRASLIAAVGMHNIIFEGSPGCGKSMCANRIRYIMPPMSIEEILDVAKKKILQNQKFDFKPIRPQSAPHHTATKASIFGGGSGSAKMGEVALAHLGVLFFDELPHFPSSILESLREPLQDYSLHISRVNDKIRYETKFLFVGAMNPCPCGNLLSKTKECRCTEYEIKRYKNRLSEPFLDRIDLFVQMSESSFEDEPTISSKELRELVINAFKLQKSRGQIEFNAKMSESECREFCKLDEKGQELLQKAVKNFSLTQRSIDKVIKVARSVADINSHESIESGDLLEALSFRKR
jgi:magnesium chelatase family protein